MSTASAPTDLTSPTPSSSGISSSTSSTNASKHQRSRSQTISCVHETTASGLRGRLKRGYSQSKRGPLSLSNGNGNGDKLSISAHVKEASTLSPKSILRSLGKMSPVASSVEEVEKHLEDVLGPLPDDNYPRIIEDREPSRGYYVALGVIMSVWMITPLSVAYLIWYILFGIRMTGKAGLTSAIFAAYALTEAVFAIYLNYLIRYVQTPSPPSNLPMETRNKLFLRVLRAGLAFPLPKAPSAFPDGPEGDESRQIYMAYANGQISAAEYRHLADRQYELAHGMQEFPMMGRMSAGEKDLMDDFVEEEDGDREKRLREQVEGDVLEGKRKQYEGIDMPNGEKIKLHPSDRRAVEFRERLRTWFDHASWDSIKRENVLIWLSWSCFNLPIEDAREDSGKMAFLEEVLDTLEARTGWTFPEGFDPRIKIMRLTLDPVNAKGRPLVLYALSGSINWFLKRVLYPFMGMGLYKEGDMEYLIRIPEGWTPERAAEHPNAVPVVYMHGLGFGLLQSHLLIKHLIVSLPTHPICIPISPHTSQSFFSDRHLRPWQRTEMIDAMQKICIKWGFWHPSAGGRKARGGVSMLSHSNGSVGHGWILKDCPSMIKRSCFVDPVVFCLWEGDVCHSFCYRKPATALELLLYYFIASEIGIANYIQRHFDWADNTLFFDEIPAATDPTKTAFFIGGTDIILDADRVRRYLQNHGVKSGLHWNENAGHGDSLKGDGRDRVVMFVGTGSTRGWQGWLKHGRRSHSLGMYDLQYKYADKLR